MKFIKLRDQDNKYDNYDVEICTDALSLPEVFEVFKSFLQASGYTIEGDIVEVKDEICRT